MSNVILKLKDIDALDGVVTDDEDINVFGIVDGSDKPQEIEVEVDADEVETILAGSDDEAEESASDDE